MRHQLLCLSSLTVVLSASRNVHSGVLRPVRSVDLLPQRRRTH